ncbi:MAG: hypothetical protein JW875_00850 [Spirochaetales bacterium]|nr:hypothetical protein [Spirochaetales bacterium]
MVLPDAYNSANYTDVVPAGVDCIGFAQRAASYDGNTYQWNDLPKDRVEGNGAPGIYNDEREYPLSGAKSDRIVNYIDFRITPEKLKKIKPGDIVYYGTSHIGIIQSVSEELLNKDMNGIDLFQINELLKELIVIESFYWADINYVAGTRSISDFHLNEKQWEIVRLRQ